MNPNPTFTQGLSGLGAILLIAWTVVASALVFFGVLNIPHWLAWGPFAVVVAAFVHYAIIAALIQHNTKRVLVEILGALGQQQLEREAEARRKSLN